MVIAPFRQVHFGGKKIKGACQADKNADDGHAFKSQSENGCSDNQGKNGRG